MKKIFSILCIFALIATATVANATPDVIDTSPIVCVDNYTPATDVVVDVPTAPVFVLNTLSTSTSFVTIVESPVPLEPDLGCTDNYNIESNTTALTPDILPLEPDLLTEPAEEYPIDCTTETNKPDPDLGNLFCETDTGTPTTEAEPDNPTETSGQGLTSDPCVTTSTYPDTWHCN